MAKLKYSFFPGCVTPLRLNNYELATRNLAKTLGIELLEMEGAGCCGATVIKSLDYGSWLTIAARNICIAEEKGANILTLCPTCSGTLGTVNETLRQNAKLRNTVNKALRKVGKKFKGTLEIRHMVRALVEDVGLENVKSGVKMPFKGLRVVAHYGCHLVKPSEYVKFDDPEIPKSLDELINLTGAESVDYVGKEKCCGAPLMAVDEDLSRFIGREKLLNMKKAKADAIVTVCPFCHIMLNSNQQLIEETFGEKYEIPVLHYPQLLGLSMGLTPEQVGLQENGRNANSILKHLPTTKNFQPEKLVSKK